MAVIDIDKAMTGLNAELAGYREKIKETENKIEHLRELAQMFGITPISTESGKRTISDAIVDLLEAKKTWMSTGEIADELLKQGLDKQSASENFRLLAITTVPKLEKRKAKRIQRYDGPNGIKYGFLGLARPDAEKGGTMLEKD